MEGQQDWLEWTVELQALGQAGEAYANNAFDLERFARIRELAGLMAARLAGENPARMPGLFTNEKGYQTPKLDSRAAVVRDGKILLVQEDDGRWALPGGWVDVDRSVGENAVKETLEEAGYRVRASRLVALLDRRLHNPGPSPYGIIKAFVLCDLLGGSFGKNPETLDSRFFGPDELPEMALSKTTPEQVHMCLRAAADPGWVVLFD